MGVSISRITALIVSSGAIYNAYVHFWISDDAYISFRYASNLIRGYGLVFNRGEYVEGITNFLWTLILVPFLASGFQAERAAGYLGILFFLLLFVFFVFFQSSKKDDSLLFSRIPLFVIVSAAFHEHLAVYATGGLETMMFVFLVSAGVVLCADHMIDSRRSGFFETSRMVHAGLTLLSISFLVRPDGAVFYISASVFLFLFDIHGSRGTEPSAIFTNLLKRHGFFIFILTAITSFRMFYYGDIFPNTFYAKSAYDLYFSQGLSYILLYFQSYYALAVIFLFFILFLLVKRQFKKYFFDPVLGYILTVIVFWFVYVLQVGGDFMFARFMLPVTVMILLFIERLIYLMNVSSFFYGVLCVLASVFLLLRYDPYAHNNTAMIKGITAESRIYSKKNREIYNTLEASIHKSIKEANPVLGFRGSLAGMIYRLDVQTAIETETGLTDRVIAKKRLSVRGRIGHEKEADLAYLQKRKTAFVLGGISPGRDYGYNRLVIDGFTAPMEIVSWQPEVMQVLAEYGNFHFTDFPSYLDKRLGEGNISNDEAKSYIGYYFNHVSDGKRLLKLKKYLIE